MDPLRGGSRSWSLWLWSLTVWSNIALLKAGRGAGKRRGLGPRNDVLTTCKAVTQRGGQQIITVFFPQEIFLDFLEARSEPAEEIRNA